MNLTVHFLMVFFSGSLSLHIPFSPCPEYFNYHSESDIWTGRLKVNITDLKFPIHVKLEFGLKAVLKTRYVGLIELLEPPEFVIDKIIYHEIRVVNYTIRFPLPYPLPVLEAVYLQSKLVCSGIPVHGDVVTRIFLEHKFPTNPRLHDYIPRTYYNTNKNCGKCTIQENDLSNKIWGKGEWPWLGAILIKQGDNLRFHCSGTLVTTKHLITAGHCIKNKKHKLLKENELITYFGKHNLLKWKEFNSQVRNVSQIYLHPAFSTDSYKADIAIVKLSRPVELNKFVRTVCLWSGPSSIKPLIGQLGTVVGWGKDRFSDVMNSEPRMFKLPIVDQDECTNSKREFSYIAATEQTFCAGFRNGSGLCEGDSGSGLMVMTRNSDNEEVWVLRGIVSLSLVDPFNYTCDLSQYQVFTDVAHYRTWIFYIINDTSNLLD